jgi:hypothetical protein
MKITAYYDHPGSFLPLTLVSKPTTVYRDALEPSPLSNQPLVGEFLLAKMSFARACSYKPNGLDGPLSEADCRHAVVTVGSSRFSGADLGG